MSRSRRTKKAAKITPGMMASRPTEPVDSFAAVAALQKELYIEQLEKKAIRDAIEVLERDGVDAAVDVLWHYAVHISWLGGHVD